MEPRTRLGAILLDEGRTQAWLGRRVGARREQVNRWVHGIHEPADHTKDAIARALGRTTEDIFGSNDGADTLERAA